MSSALPIALEAAAQRRATMKSEVRSDGVAVLSVDARFVEQNERGPAPFEELGRAVEDAFGDRRVAAIVLRGEATFSVSNVAYARGLRFAADAEEVSRALARRFDALTCGKKPVVALVHGSARGAGFELALACTGAVATNDPSTRLGLPEVKLGLLPSANGLLRVAERSGLRVALELGTSGRDVSPEEALRLGLLDDVVEASIALETACALALELADDPRLAASLARRRRRARRTAVALVERVLLERNALGRALFLRQKRQEILDETRGHYPAPERIVELLACHGARGFAVAADVEARRFGDLVVSETAHRLVDLAFAERALRDDGGLAADERGSASFSVERVAVVGAGRTGAHVAAACLEGGYFVRLKDTNDRALGRGLKAVHGILDQAVSGGTLSSVERASALARLSAGVDYAGFRRADLVSVAVFEDPSVHQGVLRDIETIVSDRCVIAISTSSVPIGRIAEGSSRPEMVVGTHYLSRTSPSLLLEIVRTDKADPRAVATAVAVGKRQGKTIIVVRDGVGFYTTRILVPYLNEAAHLLAEGCPVDTIDRAMVDYGFPVGPFWLLDEMGIDEAERAVLMAESAFGHRARASEVFRAIAADRRKGRKNGRGFYLHGRAASSRSSRVVDTSIYDRIQVTPKRSIKPEEVALRCGLAMVNEALRAYGDGIVRSPRDGDVGAVLGLGYPRFRGGPLRYVDALGSVEVLRRIRSLEQRFGLRFEPAPLLVDMARTGKRLYG